MGRPVIDLTGQRFGNLVVLRRDDSVTTGQAQWMVHCLCKPDRVYPVLGQSLRAGRSTSCGKCKYAFAGQDEHGYEVRTWLRANGLEGGFVVVKDMSGAVVAYTEQARINLQGPTSIYPPVRAVLEQLAKEDRIPTRPGDSSWDRYCTHNGIVLRNPKRITPQHEFDAAWAECEASGIPALPMAKVGGRRKGDKRKRLFVKERVDPSELEPMPVRTVRT